MSYLHTIASLFAECNMHFCLYGAFGATLILRAVLDRRARHYTEAREHTVHGVVYFMLGLL
jgi:hypothetical protein